ncbi:MAG: MFS transporter [Pseudomonadota bacterium]
MNAQPVSGAYRKYVLYILLVVYTFNFIDRQIFAILAPAIQADLGLNDTQLGLLMGFTFALFYSVLGIPIARVADKHNRVAIISVSLALWSGMTALCGLAQNFIQLAAARVGVGVGEAGCSPPAHSIISDYFPKEERASALAVYSSGIYFGMGFAFLAGGWLVVELGWRWAFVAVGLPGVLLSVLVALTLKEPQRGAQEAAPMAAGDAPPIIECIKTLFSIPSYRAICLAVSCTSFAGYAVASWIVGFLTRVRGIEYEELSIPMAIVFGVGGAIGALVGGRITERAGKNDPAAYLRIPGYAILLMSPFYLLGLIVEAPILLYACMFVAIGFSAFYLGPSFSLVQTLAPIKMRAFSTALFFLIVNFVGLGGGPLFVGVLSDLFTAQTGDAAKALQWAMFGLVFVYFVAAALFLIAARGLKQDWDTANALNSADGSSAVFAANGDETQKAE